MAIATEKYVVDDDEEFATSPDNNDWIAQTFTIGTVGPNVGFSLESVDVKITEVGSGEVVTFEIYEVRPDEGPSSQNGTSDRISFGSVDSSDWSGTQWVNVPMSAVDLIAGKQYALVSRSTSGNDTTWRADGSAPAYTGGTVWVSADTGATWTEDSTTDFMFSINAPDGNGTLCTVGEAVNKAGSGASSTATNALLVGEFIQQSESRLGVLTKKDWVTDYSGLSSNKKYILNDCVSDMAAIYIANYDDSGYSSGLEYERKIAILKAEVREMVRELKDLELQELM